VVYYSLKQSHIAVVLVVVLDAVSYLRLAYVVGMAFSPYFIFLLHLSFVVIAIFLMKYTLKDVFSGKKRTHCLTCVC
jgi:hypothetical protein